MRRRGVEGLLVRCSSVHGHGVPESIRVVHLEADGTVVRQDLLAPGRRVNARGEWILELPLSVPGPGPGMRLVPLLSRVL